MLTERWQNVAISILASGISPRQGVSKCVIFLERCEYADFGTKVSDDLISSSPRIYFDETFSAGTSFERDR